MSATTKIVVGLGLLAVGIGALVWKGRSDRATGTADGDAPTSPDAPAPATNNASGNASQVAAGVKNAVGAAAQWALVSWGLVPKPDERTPAKSAAGESTWHRTAAADPRDELVPLATVYRRKPITATPGWSPGPMIL